MNSLACLMHLLDYDQWSTNRASDFCFSASLPTDVSLRSKRKREGER